MPEGDFKIKKECRCGAASGRVLRCCSDARSSFKSGRTAGNHKRTITGLLLLFHVFFLWGQQPAVVPLGHNPVLSGQRRIVVKNLMQADTVDLPFIDDFSYYAESAAPDPALWTDRYVFINNNYPDKPPSNGVATFDALDADGRLYSHASGRFYADTLTSCPVNLGGNGIRDVYLSFFYQPQGIGDNPEGGDSLILQFKMPGTGEWRSVWNTPGTAVHPFRQVMIPVREPYLYKGFQFRFMNMVSLDNDNFNIGKKGNADHWHIDYVRLGKDRHEDDTAMYDVAVTAPMESLITGYQSIPWNQIPYAITTSLKQQTSITYRNNDNQGHFVTRMFEVRDVYKDRVVPISPGGGDNIAAGNIETFVQEILNPFVSTSVDSALFELKGYLITDAPDRKENDTVYFYQEFNNYFARDNGIPESGYGYLGNLGIDARNYAIACRYETFMPDSLRAVSMYFNPTDHHERYLFQIAVWKDDNGRPGEQVYLSRREYSPQNPGKFTRFVLEKPVYVTRHYWIGWRQVTSGFLNVGFDYSYNDRGNLWNNSSGYWSPDVNNGTLMIRPVLGKKLDIPTAVAVSEATGKNLLKVYPNPAADLINIEPEDNSGAVSPDYYLEIYRYTGQLCYKGAFTATQFDVSSFPQGVYILRLVHRKTGQVRIRKLTIAR